MSGTKTLGNAPVASCSVQADWFLARADVQTADGTSTQILDWDTIKATLDAADAYVNVPPHCTSFLARIATMDGVDAFTTDPVVWFIGTDDDGKPVRLDTSDNGGTGRTYAVDGTSTDFTFDNKFWSDSDSAPIDLLGSKRVYPVVITGSAYTDGGVEQAVELWMKFLN